MRATKVKQLRNQAEVLTVGPKATMYIIGTSPVYSPAFDNMWAPLKVKRLVPGVPTRLDDKCTRYAYKQLKRVN